MILNYEEILLANVLSDFDHSHFRNASYDLRIDKIISVENEHLNEVNLPPQGMVTVIFKEQVNLSECLIAFAHVKTSLSRIGIMALNIGIIDPGYKGYISTVIMNYGCKDYLLKPGEPCLRLTVHKIKKTQISIPLNCNVTKQQYNNERLIEAMKDLGSSFLNFKLSESRIEKNVNEWIWKRVSLIPMTIAALALIMTAIFSILNWTDKSKENYIKTLTIQTQNAEEKYKQLDLKISNLEHQLSATQNLHASQTDSVK